MLISNSKVSGIGDKCMVPLLVMGECGWCGKVDYINNEWSCWRRRRRTDVSSSGPKTKVLNTRFQWCAVTIFFFYYFILILRTALRTQRLRTIGQKNQPTMVCGGFCLSSPMGCRHPNPAYRCHPHTMG